MKYDVLEQLLVELDKYFSDEDIVNLTKEQLRLIKNLPSDISLEEARNFIFSSFFQDEIATKVLCSLKNLTKFEISSLSSQDRNSIRNTNISMLWDSKIDLKKARYYYVARGLFKNRDFKKEISYFPQEVNILLDKLYKANDKNYVKAQILALPMLYTDEEIDKILNDQFSEEELNLIVMSFNRLYKVNIDLARKYVRPLLKDIHSYINVNDSSNQFSKREQIERLSATSIDEECWKKIVNRKRALNAVMECDTPFEIKETVFAALNNGIYKSLAWDYIVSSCNEAKKRNIRSLARINRFRNNKDLLSSFSILNEDKQKEFVDKFFEDEYQEEISQAKKYNEILEENTILLDKEINKFFKGSVSREKVKRLIKTFKDKPYNNWKNTI